MIYIESLIAYNDRSDCIAKGRINLLIKCPFSLSRLPKALSSKRGKLPGSQSMDSTP